MRKKTLFLWVIISMFCSVSFLWGQNHAEKKAGVTVYKPDKFYEGYTFYNSRQREVATLIDMKGNIVHRWSYPQGFNWHHAELQPNGDIVAVIKENYNRNVGGQLLRIDWHGNLVWKMHIHGHHDFEVMDNGHIMALCREYVNNDAISPGILKSDCFYEVKPIKARESGMLNYISTVPEIVWEWHADQHALELKNFVDIEFPLPSRAPRAGQQRYPPRPRDWAHTNTVEVIPDNPSGRKDPRFRKGNVLFSMNAVYTIGIIDKETGKIVWAWGPGNMRGQHHPTMLDNGNILIFDNSNYRVIELNPFTEEIVWEYKHETFKPGNQSGSERLPNGNTLIADTVHGRLFEVTYDKEIVWEYMNPELGLNGTRMHLYRTKRYPPQFIKRLLSEKNLRKFEK